MIISRRNEKQREILMRFFRTAPGQYGEGDEFLGLKVPETRAVVKEARRSVALDDISRLLASKWHEVRLAGLLLLVEEMNVALPRKKDNEAVAEAKTQRREQLATFYITHARQANNWDLVDLSCQFVLGPYIYLSGRYDILSTLAASDNLWEQRIAVVTTLYFIRQGLWQPTFDICDMLLEHDHDLIHKAMGWMLREVGKRDRGALESYLEARLKKLPRTTLRYAIERFTAQERKDWLKR
ncbi:MAG: DNA alkylation repair protein [Duncaniella sp.]|nr:DNA alkylation repair protein [Duncaniella sp.]